MEEKDFLERIKCYITKERKLAFCVTFLTALIVHFTCYSQLVSIADTFSNGSYYLPGEWEISLGRWGIYFLNILRFGIVSPFFICLISFCFLGLTSILINDLLKLKSKVLITIISMLIVTAPYVYNILLYTYTADSYFIAMFLSVLAVKLLLDEKRRYHIYGIICIIFYLAVYQTFLSFTICLASMILFLDFAKNKITIKDYLKRFFIVLIDLMISLILYYIITKIILNILNIPVTGYYGIHDDFVYIIKNLFNGIYWTYEDFYRFYFSDVMFNNSPYFRQIIYIGIVILLNINIIFLIIRNNKEFSNKFIKILAIFILFLILPIMQNSIRLIVLKSSLAQTMCGSYIIPIIIYVSTMQETLYNKKILGKLNYLGVILIFYLIYTYTLMGEATYISIQKNYNQIQSELLRIVDRIECDNNYSEDIKIAIIGDKDFKQDIPIYKLAAISGRIGFYGLCPTNAIYNTYLKEEFGIKNEIATDEEMEKIYNTDEYKRMKEFPNKDSVKVINNIMVIKLENSEYSVNKKRQEN